MKDSGVDILATYLVSPDPDEEAVLLKNIIESILDEFSETSKKQAIGKMALILPLYLARKNVDLLGEPATASVLAAFSEVKILNMTIKEIIEGIIHELKLEKPIQWHSPDPIDVIGFDPRFKFHEPAPGDSDKGYLQAFYKAVFNKAGTQARLKSGKIDLMEFYSDAKAGVFRDFHDRSTRYDLIIADFAWLPELAYQGHVIPLENFLSCIEKEFDEVVEACCKKVDRAESKPFWTKIISYLTKGGNGYHYAFPLFLNLHGRLVPHKNEDFLSEILDNDFSSCNNITSSAVQTKMNASAVYQFYAYLAYRGAIPIDVDEQYPTSRSKFTINKVDFSSQLVRAAMGDYLARIAFSTEADNRFCFGHGEVVDELIYGRKECDMTFNSELLNKIDKSKLKWKCPPVNSSNKYFLTSLGGYGLAISRQAVNIESAFRIAREAFKIAGLEAIEIPGLDYKTGLIHPDIISSFPKIEQAPNENWLKTHCRPRIPFWSQVEEMIGCAIYDLVKLKECEDAFHSYKTGDPISGVYSQIKSVLDSAPAINILRRLEERIKLMFRDNGWEAN